MSHRLTIGFLLAAAAASITCNEDSEAPVPQDPSGMTCRNCEWNEATRAFDKNCKLVKCTSAPDAQFTARDAGLESTGPVWLQK